MGSLICCKRRQAEPVVPPHPSHAMVLQIMKPNLPGKCVTTVYPRTARYFYGLPEVLLISIYQFVGITIDMEGISLPIPIDRYIRAMLKHTFLPFTYRERYDSSRTRDRQREILKICHAKVVYLIKYVNFEIRDPTMVVELFRTKSWIFPSGQGPLTMRFDQKMSGENHQMILDANENKAMFKVFKDVTLKTLVDGLIWDPKVYCFRAYQVVQIDLIDLFTMGLADNLPFCPELTLLNMRLIIAGENWTKKKTHAGAACVAVSNNDILIMMPRFYFTHHFNEFDTRYI